MPKKARPIYEFTAKEFQRLREIQYYYLIKTLLGHHPNPNFVFNFIESFGVLFGLKTLHLQKAIRDVVMDNTTMAPSPKEAMLTLYMAGAPIHTIMKLTGKGQASVLNAYKEYQKDPFEILPKYGYTETETISKFMSAFRTMTGTVFFKEVLAHDGT
jgi:hypothetical protein